MKRSRLNPMWAKIHRSYNVAQIARLFGVHRNTVRHWMQDGLAMIEGIYPTLVLGAELRRYLTERRSRRKQPTPLGHIHCVGCRGPRRPALGMVDYLPRSPTNGNLQGICPTCGAILNRCVRLADLPRVTAGLDVRTTLAPERLRQTALPSVNNDSDTPCSPYAQAQP